MTTHFIRILKDSSKEDLLNLYKHICILLLEQYASPKSMIKDFEKNVDNLISNYKKNQNIEKSKFFPIFDIHDNFTLEFEELLDNESIIKITLYTWYLDKDLNVYPIILKFLMEKYNVDYIGLNSDEDLAWEYLNTLRIDSKRIIKQLSDDNYGFHYISKRLIKNKLKNDASFIPYRYKLNMDKGILFFSKYFKFESLFKLYKKIIQNFGNYKPEEKIQCPECHSTDIKENTCTKCGRVISSESGKASIRHEHRKAYAIIEYKCNKCKNTGIIEVDKTFFNNNAPCPECGEKEVKFKIKEIERS